MNEEILAECIAKQDIQDDHEFLLCENLAILNSLN